METTTIVLGVLFIIIMRAWLASDNDDDDDDCDGLSAWYNPLCPEYWILYGDDDDNNSTWDDD